MGLFGKKAELWWEKGHASGKVMSQVEKQLHEACIDFIYNAVLNKFFIALERMVQEGRRANCVISHPRYNIVRITTYTSLPMIAEAGDDLLKKFAEIRQESKFANIGIDKQYGFVIVTYDFDDIKGDDWFQYIVPIMIEHARVIDEHYDDILHCYPETEKASYPYVFLIPDLKAFERITLNKIYRIGEDVAIVHKKYNLNL